jgi:hypothetical protein
MPGFIESIVTKVRCLRLCDMMLLPLLCCFSSAEQRLHLHAPFVQNSCCVALVSSFAPSAARQYHDFSAWQMLSKQLLPCMIWFIYCPAGGGV